MKYSIVIISKDNRKMVLNCLKHLAPETRGRAEIVLAEAGDGLEPITEYPVEHIRMPAAEAGFSPQRNAGLLKASGNYVIFIDDDIEVQPGWFGRITQELHVHKAVLGCMGAVFPKPTGVISFITGVLGHPGGGFRLHHHARGSAIPLPQIATCNTLLRREALLAVGGFSKEAAFGGEDTELSIRLTERYGTDSFRYLPDAIVWHYSKNELGKLVKWYLRRGYSDGELFMLHPSHRGYVLRSAVTLKILAVLLLASLAGSWVLAASGAAWYLLQAWRMRFMAAYFHLYAFSRAERVFVYALAPLIKLLADVTMDLGRVKKVVELCLNA